VSAKVRCTFTVERHAAGEITFESAKAPRIVGRVPRVSRLTALAHQLGARLQPGQDGAMTELAAELGISRARLSQIMDLLLLAPDIQEELLFLPRTVEGRDPITLRAMRYVCATPIWTEQRVRWQEVLTA
jgi:hypothetical protein